MTNCKNNGSPGGPCLTRRSFFLRSGAVVGGSVLLSNIPGLEGKAIAAEVVGYPRKLIGHMSKLRVNKPVPFSYPDEGMNSSSMLVKLDSPAGGGIGAGGDVVAFNTLCTHMGGPLAGAFRPDDQALGPYPCIRPPSTLPATAWSSVATAPRACHRFCWSWTATRFMRWG